MMMREQDDRTGLLSIDGNATKLAAVLAGILVTAPAMAGCYNGLTFGGDQAGQDSAANAEDANGGDTDAESDGDSASDDDPQAEGSCRVASESGLRLLTSAEYANVIESLTGETFALGGDLPGDGRAFEIFSDNEEISMDVLRLSTYQRIAESISESDALAGQVQCDADDELACARDFIVSFGQRAFRGPMTVAVADRWLDVYQTLRDEPDAAADHEVAMRAVIAGMLQSPSFLYVVERGDPSISAPTGTVALSSHELAHKLSLLFWDDLPDTELLALAEDDSLQDPDVRFAQAVRLFEDPRARTPIRRMVLELIGADRIRGLADDPGRDVSLALVDSMSAETTRFIDEVLWGAESPTLATLFTADFSFLNAELAVAYGLDLELPDDELVRVELPAPRRGLLGQASFLANYREDGKTIHRGLRVFDNVFCQSTPPPSGELDLDSEGGDTPRERAMGRIDNPTCGACHKRFETIGLAFEPFDEDGRFRTSYENGAPATGHAIIDWFGEELEVDGPDDLMEFAVEDPNVMRCFVERAMVFAQGPGIGGDEEAARPPVCTDALEANFVASGGDVRELLLSLVAGPAFGHRWVGSESTCQD